MSDIIKEAQRLLEGATPGPWEWEERKYRDDLDCHHDWLGSEHGTALETFDSEEYSSWVESSDSDRDLIAAAPELAQALAEESWEYRHEYQVANSQQWYPLTDWAEGEPDCQPWNITPTRIVRRRVSQPEVFE